MINIATALRICITLALAAQFVPPAAADCFDEAASHYRVPADLLRAIAQVESSGNPHAINRSHVQRTNSWGIGLMQIESSWLPKLQRFGIRERDLFDACQSVYVGAWILADLMAETGATWNSIGRYNASCVTKTPEQCTAARNQYAWRVFRAWERIQASRANPISSASSIQSNSVERLASGQASPDEQPSRDDATLIAHQ